MKKLFKNLTLPCLITATLLLLLSASFKADDMITNSYKNYVSVLSSNIQNNPPLLIIDAGHGGADGGAISITNRKESEINLEIAKKTEYFAAFFGIKTIMTRINEDITYPERCVTIREKKVFDMTQRVELINSHQNAILISIHQNKYSDSSVQGAQAFFKNTDTSIQLSYNVTAMLESFVETVRQPKQISDTIYIFKNITCPAIMLECGFISNSEENSQLNSNEYQNKLAISMICGYLNSENDFIDSRGGTNESQNSLLLY